MEDGVVTGTFCSPSDCSSKSIDDDGEEDEKEEEEEEEGDDDDDDDDGDGDDDGDDDDDDDECEEQGKDSYIDLGDLDRGETERHKGDISTDNQIESCPGVRINVDIEVSTELDSDSDFYKDFFLPLHPHSDSDSENDFHR